LSEAGLLSVRIYGNRDENSASPNPASDSGCCAAGPVAHSKGASLSVAHGHDIVPFAAGGGSDILPRLMGQWLSERLGQQFIVEDRPSDSATQSTAPRRRRGIPAKGTNGPNALSVDALRFATARGSILGSRCTELFEI
jgi:hypothetical protein